MPTLDQLDASATTAEIASALGLSDRDVIRLASEHRGDEATDLAFAPWYAAVMEPIGVDRDAARAWFSGNLPTSGLIDSMPADVVERFNDSFESLQSAYEAGRADRTEA